MSRLVLPEPHHQFDAVMEDGAVIRLRRHGNPDGLRIVVSHGNGFAADAYFPFWGPLLDRCEVVAVDLRNYGRNPFHGEAGHSFARIIADLRPIADAIRAELGARTTVGAFHSLSARANLKHAVDHGGLWDAMVLFDPPMAPPPGHELHEAANKDARKLAKGCLGRRERFADPSELAALFARAPVMRDWVPGAHDLAARSVLRPDAATGEWVLCCPAALESKIYSGTMEFAGWPPAEAFDRPLMLICADPALDGAGWPSHCGRALHDEMGYAYEFLPGTRHFLQLEQPGACARIMLDFLAEAGVAGR